VTDRQTIRAPAGDAVEAWRKISEGSVENFERENTYYLCSGNKAHSVALALRALAQETPTLLYNKPEKHLPTDVSCSGVYWSYSVSRTAGTVFG
jgi:ABC-type cobalamin/Fe3+-siderophores transport system ATPase subunit